ncbi:MAG: nucleotide exchange factor GrpE [Candidatus Omnitrophota bacterium]|nr:nucleotide exchange factor GrpE [Candidatus Omnitrophota bacterium]
MEGEESKIPEDELNTLKEKAAKADEYLDKMLRIQADYDNRRKRQDREKLDFIKFANEGLIAALLNVMDDFERAIDSAKNSNDAKALLQGIEMIRQHFQATLEDYGLKKIDPEGQPFDPDKHEAIAHIEDDGHPENIVLEVMRKGYELNGKVLRPAVVKVSKKKTEKGKSEEEI